jgi:predicted ArsR family transcriptional regulator
MDDLDALALLHDPARRALYEYVVSTGREVGRNEAAEAVGMQRTLAAFHLDRLAEAGLLEVSSRRLNARSGPGAGRPAKLYRRAETEHTVSVPPRDYARAASLLAETLERNGGEQQLFTLSHARGAAEAQSLHDVAALRDELQRRGYAPYLDPETQTQTLRLRNCPFHALAQEFAVLACGMNLALLEGMLEGAGLATDFRARLAPRAGECCVVIESKDNQT